MFAIIFDLKTYIDDDINDISVSLNFVPAQGMTIYIEDEYYSVEDIDYLLKDDIFLISLKELEGSK